jgi:hypothetical protein
LESCPPEGGGGGEGEGEGRESEVAEYLLIELCQ